MHHIRSMKSHTCTYRNSYSYPLCHSSTPKTEPSPSVVIATTETEVMKEACVSRYHNHASTDKKASHRHKGPAGFASVEDLMHRLFVAISGVADQLQTNYARDLRVILKHVFTVCQSEPDSLTTSSGDMCPDADEPCTPEPQSPFLTPESKWNKIKQPEVVHVYLCGSLL